MRILLYGGSFDPPHYGHMNNLRAAAARVCPDRVVVMPAGVSPFKQGASAPGPLRVEMCGCFAELAREMGWAGKPSRLRGFLEAKAGVSDVKFLSKDHARRIIEALKAIQKGGRAERRKTINERLDE